MHFEPIPGFTDVHAGLYWQRVREDYPQTQSRPRGDTPIETLSSPSGWAVGLPTFELVPPDKSLGNRTWLVSSSGDTLLQIQDTLFIRNWRRREAEYPHLDDHVEAFWSCYDAFEAMLTDEDFTPPVVRQLELTYFNWIPTTDPSFFLPAVNASLPSSGVQAEPELARCLLAYLDKSEDGEPIARLRVELQPALKPSEPGPERGYRLLLSYMAPVSQPTRPHLESLIARGRRVIDWSFVDLTTPDAHESWGRIR